MKPIKFRGRDENGKLHYGYFYVDRTGYPCIAEGHGGTLQIVDKDSIAQLVGYDCNGNELYEGDTFVISCGTEIAARLFDNIIKSAKLKEAEQ